MRQPKHGMSHTKIYRRWRGMVDRCTVPNSFNYHHYGAMGVTVCDEWKNDFMSFYTWAMANGYEEGLDLTMKDRTKGYAPSNCEFKTRKDSNKLRANNRFITIDGVERTLVEWSRFSKLSQATILYRLKKAEYSDTSGYKASEVLKPGYDMKSGIMKEY